MFDFTPYSAFTIILTTSIFILLFVFITNKNSILSKIPMWILVSSICIMCFRLIFPFEILLVSKNINSFDLMPYYDKIVLTEIRIFELTLNIWNIACIIWVVGTIIAIGRYFVGYYIFTSNFKFIPETSDSRLIRICTNIQNDFNYNFKVKIISNKYIDTPAEYGFFKKVVLIDTDKYTDEELYYILLHELTHFRIRTNYVKFILNMIKAVLWWNPVIYLLYEYIDNILEVYVDRFVIQNCSSKNGYMQCIANVVRKSADVNYNMNYVQPMAILSEGKIVLKRLKLIALDNKYSIKVCILICLLLFMYVFVSSRYVIQPAYDTSEEDTRIPDLNNNESYILEIDDGYMLYYDGQPICKNENIEELPKGIRVIKRGE